MIVASLLLIVVAVTLLLIGLIDGANGYLVGSIAASLLASLSLIVAGRQHAARRVMTPAPTLTPTPGHTRGTHRVVSWADHGESETGEEEPAPQPTSVGDAARVACLAATVIVVAGRGRYHRDGCCRLLGRTQTSIRASQAVEEGYTPCGVCEPDTVLLASR